MLNFDEINGILNAMAEQGILESMVEPIDDPSIQVDFYDWADVVGLNEEIEPGVVFAVDDYREDFHADEAVGYVSYGDDNPFGD